MAETIDWPPARPRRGRGGRLLLVVLAAVVLGGGTTLSYYVEALWFESLGYLDVFWKTLNLQAAIFTFFAVVTFLALYGAFLAFKPARLGELASAPLLINGQPLKLPVEPVLRLIALGLSLFMAAITGAGMMAEWSTLALYWYAPTAASTVDPIFGRSLTFYFFTLPAWQLLTGWLLTLAIMAGGIALAFIAITGGGQILDGRDSGRAAGAWRGLSISFAVVLLMLAARVYFGRFERLFEGHTIFSGVGYTDAHVTLTGMIVVVVALVVGAAIALVNAVSAPRVSWLVLAIAPAFVCYVAVGLVAGSSTASS